MFMLGYAWQKGWVPLARESIERAIELNGVAVDFNRQSFVWGRAPRSTWSECGASRSPRT